MSACPSCEKDSPKEFQFCPYCGASLAFEGRELRKTVTVVFSDVSGSTSLGERLDPESLRSVMSRYFEVAQAVLERHGGTVEKFIGDAVMAVFGVPVVHEDDALRAIRAADELGKALTGLNDELEGSWGARLQIRTGVNTGEVVAGDPSSAQSFVSGDAVNVAARLEQAAQPGEILIGADTLRLVKDAVTTETIAPLSLKGKAELVPVFRLLEVRPGAPALSRRLDSPMVGRDGELRQLVDAFDRSEQGPSCELVSVLGEAGVGKSRLSIELLSRLAHRARVLEGRCLPYGDGITFWPVAEMVKQAAEIDQSDPPREALAKTAQLLERQGDDAALIRDRVGAAIGLGEVQGAIQETFWAIRRLLESRAGDRPLVAVFDDIHWGEPTLLDLIDYLAGFSRGHAILLLCTARPELRENRPDWGRAGTVLELSPLAALESERLVENLLGQRGLPAQVRAWIVGAAEGNPLFLEEMLRMLIDDGILRRDDGQWVPTGDLSDVTAPRTIRALISARLDRLDQEERAVLQRASVVGRVFYWGAVTELSPQESRAAVGPHLQTLQRRELIQPEPSPFAGEDAFRFSHLLVRDAAYESMPKRIRAELHQRFASWLEGVAGERLAEYEEIVGYHLEQAHRYRLDLGPPDDRTHDLAARAAERLSVAGRRAKVRHDVPAAANLLGRAVALAPSDDPELLVDLGEALYLAAEFPQADATFTRAVDAADLEGNFSAGARARLLRAHTQLLLDPEGKAEAALTETERLIPTLTEFGDDGGLAAAYFLRAQTHWMHMSYEPPQEDLFRAAAHARSAGDRMLELESLAEGIGALIFGPMPPEEVLERVDEVAPMFRSVPWRASDELRFRSFCLAMLRRFDEARELAARAAELCRDLGDRFGLVAMSETQWTIERLAGDHEAGGRVRRRMDGVRRVDDRRASPARGGASSCATQPTSTASSASAPGRASTRSKRGERSPAGRNGPRGSASSRGLPISERRGRFDATACSVEAERDSNRQFGRRRDRMLGLSVGIPIVIVVVVVAVVIVFVLLRRR